MRARPPYVVALGAWLVILGAVLAFPRVAEATGVGKIQAVCRAFLIERGLLDSSGSAVSSGWTDNGTTVTTTTATDGAGIGAGAVASDEILDVTGNATRKNASILSGVGGTVTIASVTPTTGATGGPITVTGGAGEGDAAGGTVTVRGGAGGATSGDSGHVRLQGGAGGGTDGSVYLGGNATDHWQVEPDGDLRVVAGTGLIAPTTLSVGSGTAGSPQILINDTNSGWFSDTAGRIQGSTDGAMAFELTSTYLSGGSADKELIRFRRRVTDQASGGSVSTGSLQVITNAGASGATTHPLPTDSVVGQVFTFIRVAAQSLRVDPDTNDKIISVGHAGLADGEYLQCDTTGGSITIVRATSLDWYVLDIQGTWVEQTP